jgi:hypothetical protein
MAMFVVIGMRNLAYLCIRTIENYTTKLDFIRTHSTSSRIVQLTNIFFHLGWIDWEILGWTVRLESVVFTS